MIKRNDLIGPEGPSGCAMEKSAPRFASIQCYEIVNIRTHGKLDPLATSTTKAELAYRPPHQMT
jgi:hypothetical protein